MNTAFVQQIVDAPLPLVAPGFATFFACAVASAKNVVYDKTLFAILPEKELGKET